MTASTNHGSARWVTAREAKAAGLFGDKGLILGKLEGKALRHPGNEPSMVVFAPMGAGKGVGLVIPNLLSHRGSVVCLDPKGENFAVTAMKRLQVGPVWSLSVAEGHPSHCFNPLDTVVVGSGDEAAQAERLAEFMMPHEVTAEGHWRSKSVSWLKAVIAHVAVRFDEEPEQRHLGMVHRYMSLTGEGLDRLMDAMRESPLMMVREVAADMKRAMRTNEGPGVLSSIVKGTGMFSLGRRSGVIASRSDFQMADLFGERPGTLYLQVPLGDMALYASWLRVMIGLANHAAMQATHVPDVRPLFVLDEAATLGEMKELQDSIGQGRASNQKIFIYQDLAQLQGANKGWRSVMANCAIWVAFKVNELETAKMLSERLGDTTVLSRSFGVSSGTDAVLSHNQNEGQGEHGRRLLQPHEIINLPEHQAVVMVQGLGLPGAIRADRMKHYEEPLFAGQFDRWTGNGLYPAHAAVFAESMSGPERADDSGPRLAGRTGDQMLLLGVDGTRAQRPWAPDGLPASV